MKELLKNVLYFGAGAAFLTKEKIEELKTELTGKGKLSHEEGKQFVDDLLSKSETVRDQLELKISQIVDDQIRKLNIATRDDLAELHRLVEELQVAINKEEKNNTNAK